MSDCIFCQIAAGDIAADLVYQDDDVVAFRDITPQAPTHILIIPRRHIGTLFETTDESARLLGRMQLAAIEIARREGLEERGFRLVTNCLEEAGQSVFHLHLHLLGGRRLGWPPG
jgi:histidine triad (HIT) family protein